MYALWDPCKPFSIPISKNSRNIEIMFNFNSNMKKIEYRTEIFSSVVS